MNFAPAPADVMTIDLDGHVDDRGVRYIGQAHRQPDGSWRVLANVNGALCLVEVRTIYTLRRSPTSGPTGLN